MRLGLFILHGGEEMVAEILYEDKATGWQVRNARRVVHLPNGEVRLVPDRPGAELEPVWLPRGSVAGVKSIPSELEELYKSVANTFVLVS